jgi:orotate phosphoribosyltransferase
MCAIYKYGFEIAQKRFENEGIILKTLTAYEYVLRAAIDNNWVDKAALTELENWVKQPEKWRVEN